MPNPIADYTNAITDMSDGDLYGNFWSTYLNTINGALPVPAYWVCFIHFPNLQHGGTPGAGGEYERDSLFCAQAVHITGDGIDTSQIGLSNAPFLKGHISNGRKELEKIQVKYLETNASFTEQVLRPWTQFVAYGGLISDKYRGTMIAIAFKKVGSAGAKKPDAGGLRNRINSAGDRAREAFTGKPNEDKAGSPMEPRLIIQFDRVCPVDVKGFELSYADQQMNNREVEFIFDSYKIQNFPAGEISVHGLAEQLNTNNWKRDPFGTAKALAGRTIDAGAEFTREFRTGNAWADTALDKVTNAAASQADRVASNVINAAGEIADRAAARAVNAVQGAAQDIGNKITDKVNDLTNRISSNLGLGDFGQLSINADDTPALGVIGSPDIGRSVMAHSDFQRKKIHEFDSLSQKAQASSPADDEDTPVFNPPDSGGDIGMLAGFSGSAKEAVKGAADTPIFFPGENRPNKINQSDTPSFVSIQRSKANKDDTPEGMLVPNEHEPIDFNKVNHNVSTLVVPNKSDTPSSTSIPVQFVPIKKQ